MLDVESIELVEAVRDQVDEARDDMTELLERITSDDAIDISPIISILSEAVECLNDLVMDNLRWAR